LIAVLASVFLNPFWAKVTEYRIEVSIARSVIPDEFVVLVWVSPRSRPEGYFAGSNSHSLVVATILSKELPVFLSSSAEYWVN